MALSKQRGGNPHDEARVRKVFKRGLGKAKLLAFRLYDLRHTFASLLLAASAPITYVSAQLGHVNPSTTLRYYARWIPNPGAPVGGPPGPRHGCSLGGGRGGFRADLEPGLEPNSPEKPNRPPG